ncbi:MAG: cytochrome c biogenesis protein ResB [Deltaproteobacteria bacterium]|jgi:cytochrome c biogenesis protein
MKTDQTKKRPNIIWAIFSSVKLTVALLIILAMVSVLGTLIPQSEGAAEFARTLSPFVRRLFVSLDLFDVYHSLWFRILMGLLTLNIVVCSLDRFQGTWKRFTTRPRPDREKPFENLPPENTFTTHAPETETSTAVHDFLTSKYKKLRAKAVGRDHFFYGERGGYALFGVYLVHLSVLFILVGSLVGSFFGFEAYVNIVEGETVDTAISRKSMRPIPLGFEVTCDDFNVDFYENGAPKEYRSAVTFRKDGQEIMRQSIRVNHPATFNGVTFYQSNYGTVPGRTVHLKIVKTGDESNPLSIEAEAGKSLSLPGGEGTFRVMDLRANIMDLGPAALVSVKPKNGKTTEFWIFRDRERAKAILPPAMLNSPKFNASAFAPYTFQLEKLDTRYYTGLQVNKDPGVPIVWLGCFLMVAGLFITFFTSHRRIWVRVSKTADGLRIDIAGTCSKNPVGLQRELDRLTDNLKHLVQKGQTG